MGIEDFAGCSINDKGEVCVDFSGSGSRYDGLVDLQKVAEGEEGVGARRYIEKVLIRDDVNYDCLGKNLIKESASVMDSLEFYESFLAREKENVRVVIREAVDAEAARVGKVGLLFRKYVLGQTGFD